MKKIFLVIMIVILAGLAIAFFIPKKVGGPLCGPVCSSFGLHYWEKTCTGIRIRNSYIDGYDDYCYGFPLGGKKCYGVPYIMPEGHADIELACDYPCNDAKTKEFCSKNNVIIGDETEMPCNSIFSKCKQ